MPTRDSAHDRKLSLEELQYLINHIFLPPYLPQEDDFDVGHETALLDVVLDCLERYRQHTAQDECASLLSVRTALANVRKVHSAAGGCIDEEELQKLLDGLLLQPSAIPLHIREQNAAVHICNVAGRIWFETFELSPSNHAVYSTKGRLQRTFPSLTISVQPEVYVQPDFTKTIAQTLAKMSHQPVPEMRPMARKAGQKHGEDRDTVNPYMISELLIGFLASVGDSTESTCTLKNTREEVLWKDTLVPWRRSPQWLLIRVILDLSLSRAAAQDEQPKRCYKQFMLFLLCHIHNLAQECELPSDLLYVMGSKIHRRLVKAQSFIQQTIMTLVSDVLAGNQKLLSNRWSAIQQHNTRTLQFTELYALDHAKDASVSLPALEEYLVQLKAREHKPTVVEFQPEAGLSHYASNSLPCLDELGRLCDSIRKSDALHCFEEWVSLHLTAWRVAHARDVAACNQLYHIIRVYHSCALPIVSGNPEAYSVMLLTIFELWIACDEIAIKLHPLLIQYDCSVEHEHLESLVLPFRSQMARLLAVEEYLRSRQHDAVHGWSQLYADIRGSDCFAVQYFNRSPELQDLHNVIECKAKLMRTEKLRELRDKKQDYKILMQQHELSLCEYDDVVVRLEYEEIHRSEHRSSCKKCYFKRKANSINIDAHEWPLSDNINEAKATIFELHAPQGFVHWRDCTLYLAVDVLKAEFASPETPKTHFRLSPERHLPDLFTIDRTALCSRRVVLLSERKPYMATHYSKQKIAMATESSVCLRNGSAYRYYDDRVACFVSLLKGTIDITNACMYKLPRTCRKMQRYLFRPADVPDGPPANIIIASQDQCPEHLTLEQYQSLAAIPGGNSLSWTALLVQLEAPSIDFRKEETQSVIFQIIYQAGPRDYQNVRRVNHKRTGDVHFANTLLRALNKFLQRVEGNWESCHAVQTLISVAARLLSMSEADSVIRECRRFLHIARNITRQWTDSLRQQAQHVTEDRQRMDFLAKSVEVALICMSTFNVDQEHLEKILTSSENALTLLICSITVREGRTALPSSRSTNFQLLQFRGLQVVRRSYPIMRRAVLGDSRALDDAIRQSWSAYRPGGHWQVEPRGGGHWLLGNSEHGEDTHSADVHYNLLTGQILVNGMPLARPPSQYETHPMYRLLFGRHPVEVLPTTVPGMNFSVKQEHSGHVVHLGMCDGGKDGSQTSLMVHATRGNSRYDLLPCQLFRDVFPISFVDEYVHWYNIDDQLVELRPAKDPWNLSSPNPWRLMRNGVSQWVLTNGLNTVMGPTTPTVKLISAMLRPLTDSKSIVCQHNRKSDRVEIRIPSLKLGFTYTRGAHLESKEFPGMCLDPNQSLGTFVGFYNRLILTHRTTSESLVLLLEGEVTCTKEDDHVKVRIQGRPTRYHTLRIDNHIGRLIDNGTLQSKLWSCYLHALTSYCIPDPFLLRTGTEQALSILRSAAVRSFDQLSKKQSEIFRGIALLTPSREYYPRHECVMQTVVWNQDLSFLAQHGHYRQLVQEILDQAQNSMMFYPDAEVYFRLGDADEDLIERDNLRNATYRVSGFGGEDFTTKHDRKYASRDQKHGPGRSNAFKLASLVFNDRAALHTPPSSNLASHIWSYCSQPATGAVAKNLVDLPVGYDAAWTDAAAHLTPAIWLALHYSVSCASGRVGKFQFMMWLAALSRIEGSNFSALQTLAALYKNQTIQPLPASDFQVASLGDGRDLQMHKLEYMTRQALKPKQDCPGVLLEPVKNESSQSFQCRKKNALERARFAAASALAKLLADQWPCDRPSELIASNDSFIDYIDYVDVEKAMKAADDMFHRWFLNKRFWDYLERIARVIGHMIVSPTKIPSGREPLPLRKVSNGPRFVSIETVFQFPITSAPRTEMQLGFLSHAVDDAEYHSPARTLLEQLQSLTHDASTYERQYVEHLLESVNLSERQKTRPHLKFKGEKLKKDLNTHLGICADTVRQTYNALVSNARWPHRKGKLPFEGKDITPDLHCPRLSPVLFLQQLHRSRWIHLTEGWQVAIVNYALAIVALQRAERMMLLCNLLSYDELIAELDNPGHRNWSPFDHPETLLLEVESAIRIREVQEEIALEMRCPKSGRNSIVQLNMGEGKSSVIVPMVTATFADGVRLARVIVAKPQAKQMFNMLISKLGGMLDRRIYHMPFSRALRLDDAQAEKLHALHEECIRNGGVLLVQPEHLLSLKLMGRESYINGKIALGDSILRTLDLLDSSSRDIIDESDDILSVKFEVVYTLGKQRPIELGPVRWTIIHQILLLIRRLAPLVDSQVPGGIELVSTAPGGFPRTRILREEAQQKLIQLVAKDICEVGLHGFPVARQSKEVRDSVYAYITESEPHQCVIDMVNSQHAGSFWTEEVRNLLLLLRGLLDGNLLSFAFSQKRWRVDYGHSYGRQPSTRLAVPYKAKDQPSPRSEFSHPEVIALLTSLSYYYAGLQEDHLFLAFEHLMRSDQADSKYQVWIAGIPNMPVTYRTLAGINLRDTVHCTDVIFPLLRYAMGPINYFLLNIVFPRELLEYPNKLSSSGWDIGSVTAHPTTGFSGTNDRRVVLPLTVEHVDLPKQIHTNATVLNLLLQPENTVARMLPNANSSLSEAEWLLTCIIALDPPVRVILDVGAQILELTNFELASKWLSSGPSNAHAVIFFNDDDEMSVLDRFGLVEPFQMSPFADQLHVCLVFLDEAHTRGTDLRLPSSYRAAVTLGANLTKDRLVQACMRMRKLGKGQTVVFCVSDEIAARVNRCAAGLRSPKLRVFDILLWTLKETIGELKRHMPLWAMQGYDYERRLALLPFPSTAHSKTAIKKYAKKFREREARSLRERYEPSSKRSVSSQQLPQAPNAIYSTRIEERLESFECSINRFSTFEEEQERELAPEIEAEREVQKPARAEPAEHSLHADLKTLVATGELVKDSPAFMPAFTSLANTAAAASFGPHQMDVENGLLVTRDFARTVVIQKGDFRLDSYQRPVQWILTTVDKATRVVRSMVVVSPFEAQKLFGMIENSRIAALHPYTPRVNLAYPSLDRLELDVISADRAPRLIPKTFIVQLNLFAGQLYFSTYEEYVDICDFLGLSHETAREGWKVAVDGFILRDGEGRVGGSSNLAQSPTNFLRLLLTTIRRSEKLDPNSDMGRMLGGGLMRQEDFDR